MPDLPNADAEPLIAIRKFVRADLLLEPRKNHAGYLLAAVRVEDEFDATIPGLTLEVELKAPLLIDACRNTVSLYLLKSGVKWRVHQLEVQPSAKRSHNGKDGPIYGAHEHRGDAVAAFRDADVSCRTAVADLFAIFCLRSNVCFSGVIILP